MPITEPPLKATLRALVMPPSLAAFAVLTLAFVATFIPIYPASTEQQAPPTKLTAVSMLIPKPMHMKSTTINTISTLYSANRNALAPPCMAAASSAIRFVPSGCFVTYDAIANAKTSAQTAITSEK